MTEFNGSNREKVTITAAYSSVTVNVARNSESGPESGLFIQTVGRNNELIYASFSLKSAKALRDGIDSVIEDFEKIREEKEEAERATRNSRLLDSLPVGSVMQVGSESSRWYKKSIGWVINPDGIYAQESTWFDGFNWDITVKYNPEED